MTTDSRGMTRAFGSPAAKRAVQAVSVAVGRRDHRARLLPGFLIVGAQRSGTTTMFRALSQHPALLRPARKEVHYFDLGYTRGISWYRAHFPLRAYARRVQRRIAMPTQTFESSPYYMFHPLAAVRIARDLPGVRLLVLVRDPVARAYSAYAHERARGWESESFERALELEDARVGGEAERIAADAGYASYSHLHHAYRTRGQYIDQLERLEALFGRVRMHVVDSGDFFSAPEPVYDEVLNFLGLRHRGYPTFARHNARPRPPMPKSLRAALDAHFLPYDERLAAWLGKDPSWRR